MSHGVLAPPLPSTIPDLVLWLVADSLDQADGSLVSLWPDRSGQGNDASQTTQAAQPTFTASGSNDKPALSFNGTSRYLVSPLGVSVVPTTIIVVMKPATTAANLAMLSGDSGAGPLEFRLTQTTGTLEILAQSQASIAVSSVAFGLAWGIGTVTYDGTNWAFQIDGASEGSGSKAQALVASQADVGRNGSNHGEFFSGLIAEILVYHRVLTASELSRVTAYLGAKYGIVVP